MCTGNEAPQVSVEVLHGDVSTQPDVKDTRVSDDIQCHELGSPEVSGQKFSQRWTWARALDTSLKWRKPLVLTMLS